MSHGHSPVIQNSASEIKNHNPQSQIRNPKLFLLAVPFAGRTQNFTISAKIQDNETNEPLSYASVGIKGKPIGTISNEQGEFVFHFSTAYQNDILVVRMLGYKNFESPIWTLLNTSINTILLERSSIELQEIVVSDTSYLDIA